MSEPTTILIASLLLLIPHAALGQTAFDANFDGSGKIDLLDFVEFVLAFESTQSKYDLNYSGKVDLLDFIAFVLLFDQKVKPEDCGKEVGNGLEIIQGPDGPEEADHDNAFRSLTVHPSDPEILLIGTERNGFVKSTNGGESWTRYRGGLRHTNNGYPEVWDIAFDPIDPSNVYAATLDSPGPIIGDHPSAPAGIYKSANGGETWSRANFGLFNFRITSVQVDPDSPNVVIIGVEGGEASFSALQGQFFDGSFYRSSDRSDTRSRVEIAENETKNGHWRLLAVASPQTQLIAFGFNFSETSENLGFFRSRDSSLTWEAFASDLQPLLITGFDVSSDGQTIYANERNLFVLQKSVDGGTTWSTTQTNQANGPVAVPPSDPLLVLFSGSSTLYRSTDGLQSSQFVLDATGTITDIVVAPSDPTIALAITEGFFLYKSTYSGATFTLITNLRSDVLNN